MNQQEMMQRFAELFGEGEEPRFYFSPGRVNLIGEHTDYNGGHVFPCALTLGTYAVARRRPDGKILLYSENVARAGVIEAAKEDLADRRDFGWANYPLGVVWAMEERGYVPDSGFEMLLWGNIPNGSGLSSSASLEVLTGVVLRDLFGWDALTGVDLALIGQRAENGFCGCNCGIMDQYAVAQGKKDCAMFLDTATLKCEYAEIKLENAKIVITNSNVKHSLVTSAYNDRRSECAAALADLQTVCDIASLGELNEEQFEAHKDVIRDDICRKRAKHAVYENQRTIRAVEALKAGDVAAFGKLMNASHVSLRDDYEVSCPEVDVLVDAAWAVPGVIGSRITGGGFGGCTVSIVENDAVERFKTDVEKAYEEKCGMKAEFYVVDIGDGAGRI